MSPYTSVCQYRFASVHRLRSSAPVLCLVLTCLVLSIVFGPPQPECCVCVCLDIFESLIFQLPCTHHVLETLCLGGFVYHVCFQFELLMWRLLWCDLLLYKSWEICLLLVRSATSLLLALQRVEISLRHFLAHEQHLNFWKKSFSPNIFGYPIQGWCTLGCDLWFRSTEVMVWLVGGNNHPKWTLVVPIHPGDRRFGTT